MKKPLIKVCGLSRADDVSSCQNAGADILGFITDFPVETPWNISAAEAARLLPLVRRPVKRCVVTGGAVKDIVALARALKPDYVQLHYRETLSETGEIVSLLKEEGIGVVKTMPPERKERKEQFGTGDVRECTRLLNEAGVAAILVAAKTAGTAGKNHAEANLSLYREVKEESTVPVVLSGEISTLNIRRIASEITPDVLDILSGIEITPGFKSEPRLKEIIKTARHLDEEENKYANYGVEGGEGEVQPEHPEELPPLYYTKQKETREEAFREAGQRKKHAREPRVNEREKARRSGKKEAVLESAGTPKETYASKSGEKKHSGRRRGRRGSAGKR